MQDKQSNRSRRGAWDANGLSRRAPNARKLPFFNHFFHRPWRLAMRSIPDLQSLLGGASLRSKESDAMTRR
jgi:hypothetical protein